MPSSSGSYTFTVARDDVINASLRSLGVLGKGQTADAQDIIDCSQALNILVKEMMTDGLPLWTIEDVQFTTVAGQSAYTIGPSGAINNTWRPLKIPFVQIQNTTATNVETQLSMLSRQEYENYSDKVTQGTPNLYYYDPQLSGLNLGTLYLLPVPFDNTHNVILTCQRPIQDFTQSTDLPDFPQEWYRALKWCLADEVSSEYNVSPAMSQLAKQNAMQYRSQMNGWSQEEASVFFSPNTTGGGYGRR